MLSDFHKAKLRTHHRALDADGSGAISKADFEKLAENFAKIRGEAAGSDLHTRLLENFQLIWTKFWAPHDTDNDGEVTPDEFIAAIDGAVDAGVREDTELLPFLFDLIDADGSGSISPAEHRQFFEACSIDGSLAADTFNAIDVDGDGSITKAEFLEAGAKFFFYDEADAPGNIFWGPVQN